MRFLVVSALLACARDAPTTIVVHIALGPGEPPPAALLVSVYDRFGALALDDSLDASNLPSQATVLAPNVSQLLRVAVQSSAGTLKGGTVSRVHAHGQAMVSVVLSSSAADADSDGVVDEIDNCPNTSNHDQADRDGDGVGDACANATGLLAGSES